MNKKKTWIVGIVCMLIPILLITIVFIFVFQGVATMGENEIIHKTKNYEEISVTSMKETTVFFGDSITELCPVEDLYSIYTKQTGIPVINRGISAETTSTMLTRIDKTVLVMEPKNLVMLMGINDISQKVDNQQIVNNIHKMITLTKQKSPQAFYLMS